MAISLGLVAGSAAALYFSSRNDLLTAYNSSPACATFADAMAGGDCRYTASGMVTQVIDENGSVEVELYVPGLYAFSAAKLPMNDKPLTQGDPVEVEFWDMKVTRLDGMATADNPANDPRSGTLLVIGLLVLPLGLGATAWGIVAARRHMRGTTESMLTPGMGPLAGSDVLWR